MQQLTLDIAPLPHPTLRNYVTGANAQLVSALRALLDGSGGPRLCVWGGPGSGKTHLLSACANERGGRFVACGHALAASPGFAAGGDADLLALDDVDHLDADGQIALFNLINRRDATPGAGPLLASCSQPPAATGLRADLATRLAQGLVLEAVALTDADKTAALAEHAAQRGIALNGEVVQYLLTRRARDLPSLIALLDALDHASLQLQRPITIPLVRELLKSQAAAGEQT